ncbi:adrenocorticotropic hormone receptor-like [Centruroides vittatus]|uniref:adrenocorticotropic hormone receptor-like n=1 Tax=Centruroides vittatus TaxID=120091 RepID=UPI00350F6AE5
MPTSPRAGKQWNRSMSFSSLWKAERKIRHAAYRMIRGTDGLRQSSDTWTYTSWLKVNSSPLEVQQSSLLYRTNSTVSLNETDNENQVNLRELYSVFIPVMLTGCVLSLLVNLVILVCVRYVRRPLKPTLCFSISLSITNAYAMTVLAIGLIVNSLLPTVYGWKMEPFYNCYFLALEAFRMGGLIASVLHLLALAVNHYIGILRPLHYAATVTRGAARMTIIAIWIIPLLFFFIYFSSVPAEGFQALNCLKVDFLFASTYRLTVSLLFFMPLLMMTFMYIHIFLAFRKQKSTFINYPTATKLHKNVKAVITTLFILGTYLIGWMPAVMFFALTCNDCPVPLLNIPENVRVTISIFNNSMIVVKSFIDPIIYVIRMPEIKEALKSMWRAPCSFEREEVSRVDLGQFSRTQKNSISIMSCHNRKTEQNGNRNLTM